MTPQEIADLLAREGSGLPPGEYDETSDSPEARNRRTELLAPVLSLCQQVWAAGSEEIDSIAEKLGDGSRDGAWRGPLGDSGILDFFLGVLAVDGLRQGLQVHSLRLVGNSCADTDENRAKVVEGNHLASIIRHLEYEKLIPFTIPVLFNILVDYEPAQKLASQSYLNKRLTTLLSSPSLPSYVIFVPYFCKILALLISQDCEPSLASPHTVDILLTLATSPPARNDLDDFISLVSVAAQYLSHERFQSVLVSGQHMKLFLTVFFHAHTSFDLQQIDDPDTATQLKQLRAALLVALADVTGHDSFASHHPIQSPIPQTFMLWLQNSNSLLQSAACLALGNLSRSDEVSIPLIQSHQVHIPLVRLLSNTSITDPQILHSALSFLKNLAIPSQNKPRLEDLLGPSCVPRIFSLDTSPQVQFAAISLTRLLLVNCPSNVQRLCIPLSADRSSPAHESTIVANIVSLYNRTDADPTRLEAARVVLTLCRVLHSESSVSLLPDWEASQAANAYERVTTDSAEIVSTGSHIQSNNKGRVYFYSKHETLDQPLTYLVTQQKWPSLRSEAWFVFALMCRSQDGAGVIDAVLQAHDAMLGLIKTITGREKDTIPEGETKAIEPTVSNTVGQITSITDGLELEPQQADPKQQANMARVDRENALIMCTELLRKLGDGMASQRKYMLQDLVKEGTDMVVAQRATG